MFQFTKQFKDSFSSKLPIRFLLSTASWNRFCKADVFGRRENHCSRYALVCSQRQREVGNNRLQKKIMATLTPHTPKSIVEPFWLLWSHYLILPKSFVFCGTFLIPTCSLQSSGGRRVKRIVKTWGVSPMAPVYTKYEKPFFILTGQLLLKKKQHYHHIISSHHHSSWLPSAKLTSLWKITMFNG